MIFDLHTYPLRDLVPYTAEAFEGLVVMHNESLWPAQLAGLAAGCAAVATAGRGRPGYALLLLATAWAATALMFLRGGLAELHWAAPYVSWMFLVQALLLFGKGLQLLRDHHGTDEWEARSPLPLCIAIYGVIGYPLAGWIHGARAASSEVFGIFPDPTVMVTLGVVAAVLPRAFIFMVLPLGWCLVSGVTAWVLETPFRLVLPLAGVFCAVASLRSSGTRS